MFGLQLEKVDLVPGVAWQFLNSKEGEEVLDKINKSNLLR